ELLRHRSRATDAFRPVLRPRPRRPRCSLALPVVLLRGDCATWLAGPGGRRHRARLEEPSRRALSIAPPRNDRPLSGALQHGSARLRRRAAVPARFSRVGAVDRAGLWVDVEPPILESVPTHHLGRVPGCSGLRRPSALPIWAELLQRAGRRVAGRAAARPGADLLERRRRPGAP